MDDREANGGYGVEDLIKLILSQTYQGQAERRGRWLKWLGRKLGVDRFVEEDLPELATGAGKAILYGPDVDGPSPSRQKREGDDVQKKLQKLGLIPTDIAPAESMERGRKGLAQENIVNTVRDLIDNGKLNDGVLTLRGDSLSVEDKPKVPGFSRYSSYDYEADRPDAMAQFREQQRIQDIPEIMKMITDLVGIPTEENAAQVEAFKNYIDEQYKR